MKTTTIRLTEELDKQLTEFAKKSDLSKNQVVKKAIRELLEKLKSS